MENTKAGICIKLAGKDVTERVAHLSVELNIGRHSNFSLYIGRKDSDATFKKTLSEMSEKWIGKPLEVEGIFKGIVTAISLSRVRQGGSDFVVTGQSPTILLDDGMNARSFGERSLNQIIDLVITPYKGKFSGVEIGANKNKATDKIKYCVQYRESNFNFISRLASRYGEWFYYDGITLFFKKPIQNKSTQSEAIVLDFVHDINRFDLSVRSTPLKFKFQTYDYEKHTYPEKESKYTEEPKNSFAKIAFDKSQVEIFEHVPSSPIHLSLNEGDLDQIVELRQNIHLNEMVLLRASSKTHGLKLGSIIKLIDSRQDLKDNAVDDYGEYIITKISHEISTQGKEYTNHFEAIPKDSAIPLHSISLDPPSSEMQTAEVIENNDPQGLGRVRVQFLWQKHLSGNDAKTPWIRVASPQGGGDKGFYILPEKGDQVLVAFEHDHPESPYVLTGMFHGKAKPEHSHGENHKKSIKTKGGIEILMNDEKGKETITVTSPMHVTLNAVGGKVTITAKGDIIIQSSSGNVSISAPSTIALEANDITLKAKNSISLKAMKITEKGDVSVNIEAAQVAIEGKATASLKGAMVEVNGSGMTNIQGGMIKLN